MKRFFLALALVGIVPVCFGASVDYTSYFHNTHTYTNATVVGTNSASRGVFTNGVSAGASTFTGAVTAHQVILTNGTTSIPHVSIGTRGAGFIPGSDGRDIYFVRGADGAAGTSRVKFGNAVMVVNNSIGIGVLESPNVWLRSAAADTLTIYNGTNSQRVDIHGTYTDASNYRRGYITDSTAGVFTIGSEGLGSGATGNTIQFNVDGNQEINIDSSGNLLWNTDGGGTIGGASANRPSSINSSGTITAGSTLTAGAGNAITWTGRSRMASPSSGIITLYNSGQSNFDRLQGGGITTNFAAITFMTNAPGLPYIVVTDATGANLRKIVNAGENGGRTNVLTDATATSVLWIAVANTNAVSGDLSYEIFATDGTDTQVIKGRTQFGAAAKTTTVTCNVSDVQITPLCTAGTLSATVAANVATNNVLAISFNADTSLTTTNLTARWRIETPSIYDVNPL